MELFKLKEERIFISGLDEYDFAKVSKALEKALKNKYKKSLDFCEFNMYPVDKDAPNDSISQTFEVRSVEYKFSSASNIEPLIEGQELLSLLEEIEDILTGLFIPEKNQAIIDKIVSFYKMDEKAFENFMTEYFSASDRMKFLKSYQAKMKQESKA